MQYPVSVQLMEAAAAVLTGAALGIVYELFRCIRLHSTRIGAALADILFCLLAAWSLFLLGMGPGRGNLRLYMPAAALGSAALSSMLFGGAVRAAFEAAARIVSAVAGVFLKPWRMIAGQLKKFGKKFKNIFSRAEKRFTIMMYKFIISTGIKGRGSRAAPEDDTNEVQEIQHIYKNSDSGSYSVCRYQPYVIEKQDSRGESGSGGASAKS